ncbi:MAG TPA: hypothetical protein VM511_08170 [Luteolibacter sp.]|nr:hypothetical protein [Luteolibacter sp.]
MKPNAFLTALLISFAWIPLSQAAVVASYDFATNLTSGDTEASSGASAIQSGGGLDAVDVGWGRSGSLSDLYIRSSNTSTSLTADDYVSFTVTTNQGVSYDFTTLTFKYSAQITMTGVAQFTSNVVVRSSLDNFATDLGSFNVTRVSTGGTNILSPEPSVNLSAFTNVSGAVEFRFYVYDDVDNGQNLTRFDNITLNATVVPEVSGVSLVSIGSLLIGLRRRRR